MVVVRWQSGKGGEGGKGWVSVWGSISGLLELLYRCFPHWFCGFLAGAHDRKEKNGFGFGFAECDRGSWVK